MKKIWQLFAGLFLILASTTFTACVDGEFDEPPINIPAVDFESNTTIADLKASYTAFQLIEEDIIISGIVSANDESGNLYKKMTIQDGTAGIELSIDKTSLYNEFKLGQRVFVKCKGMYIGDYNNLIQLGYLYNGDIGRLPEVYISAHIFRDSLPGHKVEPELITLNDLSMDRVSKLVTFENVRFAEVGEVYAPQDVDATNRTLMDQAGKSLLVRTSKYSNFAGDTIPNGYGKVTGILSVFGSDWQLTLRDTADVQDFGGVAPPPPGSGTGTFEDPYDVARGMTTSSANPVWVEGYIVGNIEVGTENVPNFAGPFVTNSNFLIAATAEETNVANCIPVQLPSGAIRDALSLVTVPGNKGKLVMVLGTLEPYFSQAGVKNTSGYWLDGSGIVPATGFFTEEFSNTLGTFSQVSVAGDQVWAGDTFDGGCVTMTGYVSPSYFVNEDWLISPSISLAGKTGVKLIFREAVNYVGTLDETKAFVSTNYSGSGDPNSATWTELTGYTRSPGNSWTFVNTSEISLSAYEGQNIHIAFKYVSTAVKAGTWEISRVVVSAD
ncbi:MAG: DUF5689 domain-containing protein [Lentimicrobium sp.]